MRKRTLLSLEAARVDAKSAISHIDLESVNSKYAERMRPIVLSARSQTNGPHKGQYKNIPPLQMCLNRRDLPKVIIFVCVTGANEYL